MPVYIKKRGGEGNFARSHIVRLLPFSSTPVSDVFGVTEDHRVTAGQKAELKEEMKSALVLKC